MHLVWRLITPATRFCQFGIFIDKSVDVRPNLRTAVAQPHGINIAGYYISIGPAVFGFIGYRGIQRVRETVLKQPAQFGVLHFCFKLLYRCFYRLAGKFALRCRDPYYGVRVCRKAIVCSLKHLHLTRPCCLKIAFFS
jgi:hypothetical protein